MHILYIDDDTNKLQELKAKLERVGGHSVETASSGKQGMKQIELLHDHLDLVITDMEMGIISGLDIIRFIKEKYPTLKIILKSSGFFEDTAKQEDVPFYWWGNGTKALLNLIENLW